MTEHPARYWHALADGRIQCDLCPRDCRLHEGQRGACFVRQMEGGRMVLTTYGRSSGFCIDPIEKKPLNHFYPGSSVFSFGTAGCNLACKFCQNWDISKSRDMDRLMDAASPAEIARVAAEHGCRSVAFTYNDPVIFAEYAIDTAVACHAQVFPTGGTRVLAYPAAHFAVADGKADYAFAYFNLRMGRGRSEAVKRQAGEVLAAAAKAHLAPVLARRPVGLTLQVDEGPEVFDAKFGNLHPLFAKGPT